MAEKFTFAGTNILPGSRQTLNIPIPQLYTHTPMDMPVHVVRGKRDGPRLVVCAAIHGDELNGVEIIRRLMFSPSTKRFRGIIIAIPMVNLYGVIHGSRYLPDRRDLNRSFPGSETGSHTSRLANLLITEVFSKATHAIDLHTGAVHRSNLPQIRADLDNDEVKELAYEFGAPVVLNSKLRDGSLRQAATDLGIPILMYEAGEALRFDEISIRVGVRGIVNVMRSLGMLPKKKKSKSQKEPIVVRSSSWTRAPTSGILLNNTPLGAVVNSGDILGAIVDPFGQVKQDIAVLKSGVVIGRTHLPLVNEGDAIIHIAHYDDVESISSQVTDFQDSHKQAVDSGETLSVV